MCLTTEQKWPKIAWKPITTYKVVYSPSKKHPLLLTLFQGFPVDIGTIYKETLRNIFESREKYFNTYEMYKGLHSNTIKEPPTAIANFHRNLGAIVVECTIPRFSLYWIGVNNDVVSNKLKYVKIL